MSDHTQDAVERFDQLELSAPVLKILGEIGYESPSPIQAAIIPFMLDGRDVLGQAQTGTGKTAAFALPILTTLDPNEKTPQVLVLAPTRELAIQVAEAFQKYATYLKGFRVLPVYGGQDYRTQLRQLDRGVQVVVGTPGRVMDHIRRGTLNVSKLKTLVLDEADEMLRMGFIDDVEWVLEQIPEERQIALFSATMPREIERIARRHLNNAEHVRIEKRSQSAMTIRQRFLSVRPREKLESLTRLLETEEFEGMIGFVRTKAATEELAERLRARGHSVSALNGDMNQKQREQTVEKLKSGALDIVIATDVAARGLDVDRITHVINIDIPFDAEAYVHRIGRTGRAGRDGDAILFVGPREHRMLNVIERATGSRIEEMRLPTLAEVNANRLKRLGEDLAEVRTDDSLKKRFEELVELADMSVEDIALALMAKYASTQFGDGWADERERPGPRFERGDRQDRGQDRGRDRGDRPRRGRDNESGAKTERYRVEVGREHDLQPGNLVGAIANEAGVESRHMGRIEIRDDHSFIELPEGMPSEIFKHLQSVWVCGQQLKISRGEGGSGRGDDRRDERRGRGERSERRGPPGAERREHGPARPKPKGKSKRVDKDKGKPAKKRRPKLKTGEPRR